MVSAELTSHGESPLRHNPLATRLDRGLITISGESAAPVIAQLLFHSLVYEIKIRDGVRPGKRFFIC